MFKYKKKPTSFITAVRLCLDTDGFIYQKWGSPQRCKQGDWLVNNNGDYYTIDGETFDKTYEYAHPGVYAKKAPVWAFQSKFKGSIETKEGRTFYEADDYIVHNNKDGTDGYAMSKEKFESMYERVD